ncbi:MAG TPA: exosortase family protein XrtF [Cytophagaceae bacterium]
MKQYKPLIKFFLSVVIVYIIWSVADTYWLRPEGKINSFLRNSEAYTSKLLLGSLGYEASFKDNRANTATIIYINSNRILSIADSCNALVLFVIFAGFIIAYPGKWKTKLWFLPVGIITIYLFNVLRISALALIQVHSPEYLDFNHHFTFTFIIYGYIFLLWVLFINRYSEKLI